MFQVYGALSQWNYWKLEIGILDSVLRQWNGFEDFNILNFSKILLKFAFVFSLRLSLFKILSICPFLSLTIIPGQRSFSTLADGLLDITPDAKNSFWEFSLLNVKAFNLNFEIFQFFKILLTRLKSCRVESS